MAYGFTALSAIVNKILVAPSANLGPSFRGLVAFMGAALLGAMGAPLHAQTPVEIIVDNTDANTRFTGRWRDATRAGYYGTEAFRNEDTIVPKYFRWFPEVPRTEAYDVYAWWTAGPNRSNAVPYRIFHTTGSDTVIVDQTDPSQGSRWVRLGRYTLDPTNSSYVEISSENGRAAADAVRFVARSRDRFIDNGDTETSSTGNWGARNSVNAWQGDFSRGNQSATRTYRWSPQLGREGTYEVYVRWPSVGGRSANVPFTIAHAAGLETLTVDQTVGANQWRLLGTYTFNRGSTGYVEISAENGRAIADAVWFKWVDTQSPEVVIDSSGAAPLITVGDPLSLTASAVDPQQGDLSSGLIWSSDRDGSLGTGASISLVVLSEGVHVISASVTDADGITGVASHVVHVAAELLPRVDIVADDQDANTVATGTWGSGDGRFPWLRADTESSTTGDVFRWTLDVPTADVYDLSAWWTGGGTKSTSAKYRVSGSTGVSEVVVDQSQNPGVWNLLGQFELAPNQGHYVEVEATQSGRSATIADAIRIESGAAEYVVDDGSPDVGYVGVWSESNPTDSPAWSGLYREVDGLAVTGSARYMRWPVPSLPPGSYEVQVYWAPVPESAVEPGTVNNAVYRIYHASGEAEFPVDQTDVNASGQWNLLGQYEFSGDGTEYVELSNELGPVVGDAVRFVPIGEEPPPLPPEVNAGPDLFGVAGDTLVLDGSGTNLNGGSYLYSWSWLSGSSVNPPNIVSSSTATPSVTLLDPGQTYTWTAVLSLTDGGGISTQYSDQVDVTVYSASDDSDNDGLFDAWEFTNFGGIATYTGQDDPDNDGFVNTEEYFRGTDPLTADVEDGDADSDGIADSVDTCPGTPAGQSADSAGCSASQRDTDGDGYVDSEDVFPNDPTEWEDTDFDGIGNNSDADRDGDGVANAADLFPDDPTESSDLDGDGIGDVADLDRDGDNVPNESDPFPNDPARSSLPVLSIDSPPSLTTVGASPISISGQLDPDATALTVNGVPVSTGGSTFSASVPLEEGHNTISARMVTDSGEVTTATITVSLDLTPPYITIESHEDGQTVYTDTINLTGLINDIVRGTVEQSQAVVTVNGVGATISNRSYVASNIPLTPGLNTLNVQAQDQVGNTANTAITLTYQVPTGPELEVVSGDAQSASINDLLAQPLSVRVTDASGADVSGADVLFRVTQGSGYVSAGSSSEERALRVTTGSDGLAQVQFRLGQRVGAGNHKVRAQVVGYATEVVFSASAMGVPGNKISVNTGDDQRGGVYQVLPQPLTVVVTDAGANVVANSEVRFNVLGGGGHFLENGNPSSLTVTTDSDGRASANWVLGGVTGFDRQRVEAVLLNPDPNSSNGGIVSAGFSASAFIAGDPGATTISGLIEDNLGNPLPGVRVRTTAAPVREAVADAQGQFRITEVPVGPVHLEVDGSTALAAGEYPTLSVNAFTVAGIDNPLPAPVYLVALDTANAVMVGAQDTELTLPEVPGFKLEVAAGSVTFPDGSNEGLLSVTPVNANKVPMAPPNGMQPQFIVTIQPAGTRFDPPAKLSLPNVDGHAPGAQVEMYSFDHDLEEFVAIGLGTVSDTGSVVESNTGVGVVKAGWHCGSQPDNNGEAGGEKLPTKPCKKDECDAASGGGNSNNACVDCKDKQRGNPILISTGNKLQYEVDYEGPGRFPLRIERNYNSLSSSESPGWSVGFNHGYSSNVSLETRDSETTYNGGWDAYATIRTYEIQMRRADGEVLVFPLHEHPAFGIPPDTSQLPTFEELLSTRSGQTFGDFHTSAATLEYANQGSVTWVYRDRSGITESYDAQGRLIRRTNAEGYSQDLSYAGNVITVTDSRNRSLEIRLNGNGQMTQVDVGSLQYLYDYDAQGRLTRVTYPGGTFKTYHYESPARPQALTGITDEEGVRYASWSYDWVGRATSSEYIGGVRRVEFSRPTVDTVLFTNEYGKQTQYTYDRVLGAERLLEVRDLATLNTPETVKTYEYSEEFPFFVSKQTDRNGVVTLHEYNDRGLEIRRTEAAGTPRQRITETDWAEGSQQWAEVREPGRTITYGYDSSRRLRSVTVGDRVWRYSYDSQGNVRSVDGPRTDVNDVTLYEYSAGNLTAVVNALGHRSELHDHNDYGLPGRVVDANGVQTVLTYNDRGWLISSTVQSRAGNLVTTYGYSLHGLVTQITSPDGSSLTLEYDDARRLTAIQNSVGDRLEYTVDTAGNRTEERIRDASGTLVGQMTQVFDDLGRLTSSLGAEGQNTRYAYGPEDRQSTMIDPKGGATGQQFDELYRLVRSEDALTHVTQLSYDPRDNVASVTDARSLSTSYEYNEHNEVIRRVSPDTGVTTYAYDQAGNVIQMTDARGVTTQYTYDAINRLATVAYISQPNQNVVYIYDQQDLTPDDNVYNAGVGRLTSMTDESGSTQFRYDDRGNLIEARQEITGVFGSALTLTTQYAYDAADQLTGITYPSGAQVSYTRDVHGRIASIDATYDTDTGAATNSVLGAIGYSAFGRLQTGTFGNGLTLNRTFDSDWRLSTNDVPGALGQSFGYDLNSNITGITDAVNSAASATYDYDAIHRLTQETDTTEDLEYAYDAVGNRLSKTDVSTGTTLQSNTYSGSSNRLVSSDGVTRTYDAVGNTITHGAGTWSYGASNRMASYSEGGPIAQYRYNGLGQRSAKVLVNENDRYLTVLTFGLGGQIVSESIYSSMGQLRVHRDFVWMDSTPVGLLQTRYGSGGAVQDAHLLALHSDHLDTPRVATDSSGAVAWRWLGGAFGDGVDEVLAAGAAIDLSIGLRFPGQYFDGESGLSYNYYRDYEPSLGRYAQSDPIGLDGGPNTYLYAFSSPLAFMDQNGLEPVGTWQSPPDYSQAALIPSFTKTSVTVTLRGKVTFSINCFDSCKGNSWHVSGSVAVEHSHTVDLEAKPPTITRRRLGSGYYEFLGLALKKAIDFHPAAMGAREKLIQSMRKFKNSDFPTQICKTTGA